MTHKKMDPEAKAKWVAALRSGKYAQTREYLYRSAPSTTYAGDVEVPAGYCCLGVLNEVCALGQDPNCSTLTIEQQESVRLSDRAASLLMEKNDLAGWDFAHIADWIEQNL